MDRRTNRLIITASVLLTIVGSVLAINGQIEINGTRAEQGGVSAADGPGYPVTISEPGSYVLTGDLEQPDPGTHVIEVLAERVTIDLNGFSIRGSNVNTLTYTGDYLTGVACSHPGSGSGVFSEQRFTRVINGTIAGMGDNGITLGDDATATGLIVDSNCGRGLNLGGFSLASRIIATKNLQIGVAAGLRSVLETCSASESGEAGIAIFYDSIVRNSTSIKNKGAGLEIYDRGMIDTCAASFNNGAGIVANGYVRIIDCSINNNNSRPIETLGSNTNVYSGCNINNNAMAMAAGVIELPPNVCDGDTSCP